MHPEAFAFAAAHAKPGSVVEIGSRDINGSVRHLFSGDYCGLDLEPGPGVDLVCDAVLYDAPPVDIVVCLEVLEHAPEPARVVAAAKRLLRRGGLLILTAACDPRPAHSGHDGGTLVEGEHYANVDPELLSRWLRGWSRSSVETHPERGDVYAVATK